MTTAVPATALAVIQAAFTDAERLALAGFLAGYRGLTREAYALDLRQFTTWCRARSLALFAVPRAGIESFARELEATGWARAAVTRRLCTIAGLCRYAVEEELLGHSPAAHVRRPRVDQPQRARRGERLADRVRLDQAAGLPPPAPPRVGVTAPQIRHQAAVAPPGEWAAVFWADASSQGYPAACPGAG
jgi:hypothetical protein